MRTDTDDEIETVWDEVARSGLPLVGDTSDDLPIPVDSEIAEGLVDIVHDAIIGAMRGTNLEGRMRDVGRALADLAFRRARATSLRVDELVRKTRELIDSKGTSEIVDNQIEDHQAAHWNATNQLSSLDAMAERFAELYERDLGEPFVPSKGGRYRGISKVDGGIFESRLLVEADEKRRSDRRKLDGMALAIAGSPDWADADRVTTFLDRAKERTYQEYGERLVLYHKGDRRGAEGIVSQWARRNDVQEVVFKPNWDAYGPRAAFAATDEMFRTPRRLGGVLVIGSFGPAQALAAKAERHKVPVATIVDEAVRQKRSRGAPERIARPPWAGRVGMNGAAAGGTSRAAEMPDRIPDRGPELGPNAAPAPSQELNHVNGHDLRRDVGRDANRDTGRDVDRGVNRDNGPESARDVAHDGDRDTSRESASDVADVQISPGDSGGDSRNAVSGESVRGEGARGDSRNAASAENVRADGGRGDVDRGYAALQDYARGSSAVGLENRGPDAGDFGDSERAAVSDSARQLGRERNGRQADRAPEHPPATPVDWPEFVPYAAPSVERLAAARVPTAGELEGSVTGAFEAIRVMLTGTGLERELEPLCHGIATLLRRERDAVERILVEHATQAEALKRSDVESAVRDQELRIAQYVAKRAELALPGLETMAEAARLGYEREVGSVYAPPAARARAQGMSGTAWLAERTWIQEHDDAKADALPRGRVVILAGDADWHDHERVWKDLDATRAVFKKKYGEETVLFHKGNTAGADSFATSWARSRGVDQVMFKPQWKEHGKRAGFIANREMLRDWPNLKAGGVLVYGEKGVAQNLGDTAKAQGIPVHRIASSEQKALEIVESARNRARERIRDRDLGAIRDGSGRPANLERIKAPETSGPHGILAMQMAVAVTSRVQWMDPVHVGKLVELLGALAGRLDIPTDTARVSERDLARRIHEFADQTELKQEQRRFCVTVANAVREGPLPEARFLVRARRAALTDLVASGWGVADGAGGPEGVGRNGVVGGVGGTDGEGRIDPAAAEALADRALRSMTLGEIRALGDLSMDLPASLPPLSQAQRKAAAGFLQAHGPMVERLAKTLWVRDESRGSPQLVPEDGDAPASAPDSVAVASGRAVESGAMGERVVAGQTEGASRGRIDEVAEGRLDGTDPAPRPVADASVEAPADLVEDRRRPDADLAPALPLESVESAAGASPSASGPSSGDSRSPDLLDPLEHDRLGEPPTQEPSDPPRPDRAVTGVASSGPNPVAAVGASLEAASEPDPALWGVASQIAVAVSERIDADHPGHNHATPAQIQELLQRVSVVEFSERQERAIRQRAEDIAENRAASDAKYDLVAAIIADEQRDFDRVDGQGEKWRGRERPVMRDDVVRHALGPGIRAGEHPMQFGDDRLRAAFEAQVDRAVADSIQRHGAPTEAERAVARLAQIEETPPELAQAMYLALGQGAVRSTAAIQRDRVDLVRQLVASGGGIEFENPGALSTRMYRSYAHREVDALADPARRVLSPLPSALGAGDRRQLAEGVRALAVQATEPGMALRPWGKSLEALVPAETRAPTFAMDMDA